MAAKPLTIDQKNAIRRGIRWALDEILGREDFLDEVNGQVLNAAEATGFDEDDHFDQIETIKAEVLDMIGKAADGICAPQ